MLSKIINYFKSFSTKDNTAINCEVFVHKQTSELLIINEEGSLEGATNKIPMLHIGDIHMKDSSTLIVNLDRQHFEYLGQL